MIAPLHPSKRVRLGRAKPCTRRTAADERGAETMCSGAETSIVGGQLSQVSPLGALAPLRRRKEMQNTKTDRRHSPRRPSRRGARYYRISNYSGEIPIKTVVNALRCAATVRNQRNQRPSRANVAALLRLSSRTWNIIAPLIGAFLAFARAFSATRCASRRQSMPLITSGERKSIMRSVSHSNDFQIKSNESARKAK